MVDVDPWLEEKVVKLHKAGYKGSHIEDLTGLERQQVAGILGKEYGDGMNSHNQELKEEKRKRESPHPTVNRQKAKKISGRRA